MQESMPETVVTQDAVPEDPEAAVTEEVSADPGTVPVEKYAELQEKYQKLQQQNILEKVCRECGCTDPAYLEFCAAREKVDAGNIDALRTFARELAAVSPGCFAARITPGSYTGNRHGSASVPHPAEEFTGDRIGLIALSIDSAPDAVCR